MKYTKKWKLAIYMGLIIVIFMVAAYVSAYHYQFMLIQGSSMEPSYHNMQLVILDKKVEAESLSQGDVIAFYCEGLDSILVKRIVATPGQSVKIEEGILMIKTSAVGEDSEQSDTDGADGVDEVDGANEADEVNGANEADEVDEVNGADGAWIPSDIYEMGIFEYEGILGSELTLGAGEYVVIGDNVTESKDSRYDKVGVVKYSSIIGKVRWFLC